MEDTLTATLSTVADGVQVELFAENRADLERDNDVIKMAADAARSRGHAATIVRRQLPLVPRDAEGKASVAMLGNPEQIKKWSRIVVFAG